MPGVNRVLVDAPSPALIRVGLVVLSSGAPSAVRNRFQQSWWRRCSGSFGQLAEVIVLGPALALGIGAILAAIAAASSWFAACPFQHEVILTRWR